MRKKVAFLTIIFVFMISSSAWALPTNTVIIGNNAFSLDFFFSEELPAEIIDAIDSGGGMYFDIGDGFIDAFTFGDMPESVKSSMNNIVYMNADASKVIYDNFYDEEPIPFGGDDEFRVMFIY